MLIVIPVTAGSLIIHILRRTVTGKGTILCLPRSLEEAKNRPLVFPPVFGGDTEPSPALLSVLLLCGILVINSFISARSGGKYSRILLLENEEAEIPVYDCTLQMDTQEISSLAEKIQDFCHKENMSGPLAALTALSVEEMSMYTLGQSKGARIDYMDILLKIYPEYVLMDFRSIGRPFDVSAVPEEYSNMQVLKKVVSSMEYDYVLGMNQTRLRVKV